MSLVWVLFPNDVILFSGEWIAEDVFELLVALESCATPSAKVKTNAMIKNSMQTLLIMIFGYELKTR